MYQIILLIHVVISVTLVGLVLIQQGKGASVGAAFGSGASNTVFGAQGTGSFLLKVTGALGLAFFTTSLILGYLAAHQSKQGPQILIPAQSTPAAPKTTSSPAKKN